MGIFTPRKVLLKRLKDRENSAYFQCVGQITAGWASLEYQLDWTNKLFMLFGGDAIEAHLPVSLKPKVRFFRKCHIQLPALRDYSQDGLTIAGRISGLQDRRHDVIHGVALSALSNLDYTIFRNVYDGADLQDSIKPSSLEDLISLSHDILGLCRDFLRHHQAVMEHLQPRHDL